ncbi:hypothetical protein AX16_000959 [Volvariella volvacea WC 439]|nr:hypothetical protein AX16_000959 [Volvariella volvacea WC 439]
MSSPYTVLSERAHGDLVRIDDRLPTQEECSQLRHLALRHVKVPPITDDDISQVLAACPNLETVVLSAVRDTSDRTLVTLANRATNLQGIDLSGCTQVTDMGIFELTAKSLPLQSIQLSGVVGLTDPSISAIAKSCSRLVELELSDLPLLSPVALRTLRLARCPLLSDKAFPSLVDSRASSPQIGGSSRPPTWLEQLPPLVLRHSADNLRVLDLTGCKITDEAVEGIVAHASKIQTFILSGCEQLTDKAIDSISKIGDHLDVLMLAHVAKVTDRGIINVARSCQNLRCIDVASCRKLTDMSIFELAGLPSLRRLRLSQLHKLTDLAVYALAEHALGLERLNLSYCDRITLEAVHRLLDRSVNLHHLTATGVPSFRRKGVDRFSEPPPSNYDLGQKAAHRVFNGANVVALRKFLDKEESRRREAELKNILFVARSDDKLDLY